MAYQATNEQLDFKYLRKFYEDKHASKTFINHCVALAEFYTQLKVREREKNKELEYDVETKTEMWITKQLYDNGDFDEIKQYIPDLYFEAIKNPEGEDESSQTFLLELFDPHMPRYAIKYRIKTYIKLKEEGNWEDYIGMSGKFPTIILIFPHHRKMNGLIQFIRDELERSYESDEISFLLTTYTKAMTKGITDKSIWTEVKTENE